MTRMTTHPERAVQTALRYHRLPLMAASTDTSTTLDLTSRAAEGSRSARRLRRTGQVPGVVYGGDDEPQLFAVDARILRNTLAHSGAILQIASTAATPAPVLVKDIQRHPVRGEAVHVDLLRVDMNETIHTTVVLELHRRRRRARRRRGRRALPGRVELNIEALPGDIPDSIQLDVSGLEMNDDGHARPRSPPPAGVTLLDDPDETVARHDHPADAGAGGGGDRDRDRGRRRGRGRRGRGRGRRGRGRRPRSRRPRRRVLKLFASAPVDWLVVGLGNPGPGYADTPHNVGFQVADALIARWDLPRPKKKFAGELTEGRTGPGGPRVAVLKPQTYMNEAGRSVGPARGSFKLELDRVLVIHDEIDLPFGDIRVRLGGGLAGHNGLKSLKRELGSRGLPPRADRRRPAGLDRSRHRRPPTCSGKWRQSRAARCASSSSARRRAERVARGAVDRSPYVITYGRMSTARLGRRHLRAHRRRRSTAMGSDVLDRLGCAATRPCSTPAAAPAASRGCCSSGCRAGA